MKQTSFYNIKYKHENSDIKAVTLNEQSFMDTLSKPAMEKKAYIGGYSKDFIYRPGFPGEKIRISKNSFSLDISKK